MDENAKTDAPDGASAQPEPTGTTPAPEQSAPQKSAAEIKLEGQLKDAKAKAEGYKKDLDTARKQVTALTSERDQYAKAYEGAEADCARYKEALEALDQADREQSTSIEVSAEPSTKDLLKRNGLPKAWVLPDGAICFSEAHAQHVAGEGFDSLTTISAE